MTGQSFYSFISKTFVPKLKEKNVQFPIVIFLDGHSYHLSIQLMQFCKENEIELIALYPNSTQVFQPLDTSVFRPLKQFDPFSITTNL